MIRPIRQLDRGAGEQGLDCAAPFTDTRTDAGSRNKVRLERAAHVAVLIISYNNVEELRDCLQSIHASKDVDVVPHVLVFDNASGVDVAGMMECEFPAALLIRSPTNCGFAEGNNLALTCAQAVFPELDYIALVNQDVVVGDGWLTPLIDYLEQHPEAACVQPTLLLRDEPDCVNTIGNTSHFLGFGFTQGGGEPISIQGRNPRQICYASGAALVLRKSAVDELGLFTSHFFMYLEDAELGWKLRQSGWQLIHVPASMVWHNYRFNSEFKFYEHLERNRWWLLLVYYRGATLCLLAPALAAMEAGQWYFAYRYGRLSAKWASYRYYWRGTTLRNLLQARRQAQRRRTISDRDFLSLFTAAIEIPGQRSWLIDRVANPLFALYWRLAKRLIVW